MSSAPRPVRQHPAYDGMELEPALAALWGRVPEDATLLKLKGDASTRSYYRVESASSEPRSLVVMRLPDEPASKAPTELPFLNVQRYLAGLGLPVPRVLADDVPRGLVLLEDLSDETFEARLRATPRAHWHTAYEGAVDLLAELQRKTAHERGACIAYTRAFDPKLLRWELEHFHEWGLVAREIVPSKAASSLLTSAFDRIVAEILRLPQIFVHRDYQSRNLMFAPRGELVIIDFQDALLGPPVYDLVALLCDSYVDLDLPLQCALVRRLADARGEPVEPFERAFWLVAVQRKLKDAGRFVFIDQVRNNPDFLPWYGPSLRYVGRALDQLPDFADLRDLLAKLLPGFPDAVATPPAQTGLRSPK
jgi:aminoglycoside/choline kinase family phosphotransferase